MNPFYELSLTVLKVLALNLYEIVNDRKMKACKFQCKSFQLKLNTNYIVPNSG